MANYNAVYEIVENSADRILLRDIGPWDQHRTITNDAEQVVKDMLPKMLYGQRLMYLDSSHELTELLIEDGRFAGFKIVNHTGREMQ